MTSPSRSARAALVEDSTDRVERLAHQVGAFWGQGYRVVINDRGPSFDWYEVKIPQEEVAEGDENVLWLLLHEWGHRCLAPRTVARGFYWEILARLEGIVPSGQVVNLAADLLVDAWYMGHDRWKEEYRRRELAITRELADHLGTLPEEQRPVLAEIAVACYILVGSWQAELGEHPILPDLEKVDKAVTALFDETRSEDQRLRDFCRALSRSFPALSRPGSATRNRGAGDEDGTSIHPASAPWRRPRWNPDELVRLLLAGGVTRDSSVVADICGKGLGRRVKARLRVLESLVRVEDRVERFVSRHRGTRTEAPALWSLGHPIRQLDPVLTLERFGLAVPGLTTLRRPGRETRARSNLRRLCLVVDNSGSTAGAIIESELDAAVALLESARRLSAEAALVVFGSSVAATVEPGDEYDEIACILAALEGQSGGTSLGPAIHKALRFAPREDRDLMATVVFSDSWVYDIDESIPPLRRLSTRGPLVFFLVDDRLNRPGLWEIERQVPDVRFVQIRPGKPLVDEALQVLAGARRQDSP